MQYIKKILIKLFSLDIRSLALLRILLSSFLLTDLIVRATDLTTFYTDNGVLPRSQLQLIPGQFSLHMLSGSPVYIVFLFILAGISCVLLCIGYHTRLNTIISWVLLISLQNRNPLILQGGDQILRMILFWSIFLPLGACYSIDSVRDISKKIPTRVTSGATFAYLLQICLIYFCTSLLKTGKEWHQEGSALYFALHIEQFATPFTKYFLMLPAFILQWMTHAVLSLEFFGSIILFLSGLFPFARILSVFAFISMHLGIAVSLSVGTIAWIPIIALLALLPGNFWEGIKQLSIKVHKPQKVILYYDGSCGFCQKGTIAAQTFLFLSNISIIPAEKNVNIYQEMQKRNSWIIVDHKGKHFYKAYGITPLLQSSLLFFAFSSLCNTTVFTLLGNKVYTRVAAHRSTRCSVLPPTRPIPAFITYMGNYILPLFFIGYIFLYNMSYLPSSPLSTPNMPYMFELTQALRLDQYWNMFAPYPIKDDGWYVIPGTLANGQQVDLFHYGTLVSYSKPTMTSSTYKNSRWTKYMMNLWNQSYAHNRSQLAAYLCQQWNYFHAPSHKLERLEIDFMLRYTPPVTQTAAVITTQRIPILFYSCP